MRNAIALNGLEQRENLKTVKRKRKIVRAVYKLIYRPKKSVPISLFLTFKNAMHMWKCYKCPCKFLFLVNASFFFPQVIYCKKNIFSSFTWR